jgi:hypothetical protein
MVGILNFARALGSTRLPEPNSFAPGRLGTSWRGEHRTYVRSLEKGATRETCWSILFHLYIYINIYIYQFHRTPAKTCFNMRWLSFAGSTPGLNHRKHVAQQAYVRKSKGWAGSPIRDIRDHNAMMPHRNTSVFPQKLGPQEFAWYSQFQWITMILPM